MKSNHSISPPTFIQRRYSCDRWPFLLIQTLFCTVKLHSSRPPELQPRAPGVLEEPSQGERIHLLYQWSKQHQVWLCIQIYFQCWIEQISGWSICFKRYFFFSDAAVGYTEFGLCVFFSFYPRIVKLYIPACQDWKLTLPTAARYHHCKPNHAKPPYCFQLALYTL